jgi:hypothetical protein
MKKTIYERQLEMMNGKEYIEMKSGKEYTKHYNPDLIRELNWSEMIITEYYKDGKILEKKIINQ